MGKIPGVIHSEVEFHSKHIVIISYDFSMTQKFGRPSSEDGMIVTMLHICVCAQTTTAVPIQGIVVHNTAHIAVLWIVFML